VDPQLKSDELTCDQAISQMTLAPASELTGSAALAEHVAGCADCARVAAVILERERATGLQPVRSSGLIFGFNRRSFLGQMMLSLVTVVAIVLVWTYVADFITTTVKSYSAGDTRTEISTIKLNCLRPEAAALLARPYFTGERSFVLRTDPNIPRLVVRGTASEIARSTATIERFDAPGNGCQLPTSALAPPHP
jgi:hypothetical protein